MSIKSMLHDEIKDEIGELNKLELGSETYKTTVEGLSKLIGLTIDMDKIEIDSQDKNEALEAETQLKRLQMDDENKDRKVKNTLTILSIVIPTGVAIWGTIYSTRFEKVDSVTTIMGRGWIQKLIPKK